MLRKCLQILAIAALPAMAAGPALSQGGRDFQVWQKNFGAPAAKKKAGATPSYSNTFVCIPSQCAKQPPAAAKKRRALRKR